MPGVISVRSIEIRRPLKKKDESYQECREVVVLKFSSVGRWSCFWNVEVLGIGSRLIVLGL